MPIDVSPPMSGNLQGFQIAQPQSTDPLQTLAQMGQLRTQGLQQQRANLQLKQQQMQMDSQKALMQAAALGRANWDKTIQLASQDPRTLPGDLMKLTQERLNIQTLGTTLKKAQQDVLATDMDRHLQNVTGVTDQESLDLANQRSAQAGVHFAQPGDPLPGVPQLTTFPSGHPEAMQAYKNSLTMHKDAMEEGLKGPDRRIRRDGRRVYREGRTSHCGNGENSTGDATTARPTRLAQKSDSAGPGRLRGRLDRQDQISGPLRPGIQRCQ